MEAKTSGKARAEQQADVAQADPSAEDDGRNGHEPQVLASFTADVYSDGAVQAIAKYPPGKINTYALTDMFGRVLKAAGVSDRGT